MAGTPPYQLGCGNGAPAHVASYSNQLVSSRKVAKKSYLPVRSLKAATVSRSRVVKKAKSVKAKAKSRSISKSKASKSRYHHR